jgi:hypothetical protein
MRFRNAFGHDGLMERAMVPSRIDRGISCLAGFAVAVTVVVASAGGALAIDRLLTLGNIPLAPKKLVDQGCADAARVTDAALLERIKQKLSKERSEAEAEYRKAKSVVEKAEIDNTVKADSYQKAQAQIDHFKAGLQIGYLDDKSKAAARSIIKISESVLPNAKADAERAKQALEQATAQLAEAEYLRGIRNAAHTAAIDCIEKRLKELKPAALSSGGKPVCKVENDDWDLGDHQDSKMIVSSGHPCSISFSGEAKSQVIEEVAVTRPPELGTVSIRGGSAIYRSNPGVRGTDMFGLRVRGYDREEKERGTATFAITVTVQ